jgi:hypothetical protein
MKNDDKKEIDITPVLQPKDGPFEKVPGVVLTVPPTGGKVRMDPNPARQYPVTYAIDVHEPGLTPTEIPEGRGGCDQMVFASIVRSPDGASSHMFLSRDGLNKGEELAPGELFMTWVLMAKWLAAKFPEGDGRHEICQDTFDIVRKIMTGRDPT